jgi:dTDP-4-dehydrorhamnose reductase
VRVLITGASGMLGGRLAELLAGRFEVVAARHEAPTPPELAQVPLDLLDATSIETALERSRADAVLHSAALADADRCEADPALAERCNVEASATLARACRLRGVRLVALSTDLVFDGREAFVREDRVPRPILQYGRTKLLGEEAVLDGHPDAAVARVALVLGRGFGRRGSASEGIAWALRAGRPLRLFTDQYRTPVDDRSAADALAELLAGRGRGRDHVGGPERLSPPAPGLRVARVLGLDPGPIEAVTQAAVALGAPRPADVSLDSGRAMRELRWRPRPLDGAILEGRAAPPAAAGRPL